jgi:hypothetical protein
MAGACHYEAGAMAQAEDMFKQGERLGREAADVSLQLRCACNRALCRLQQPGRAAAALETVQGARMVCSQQCDLGPSAAAACHASMV